MDMETPRVQMRYETVQTREQQLDGAIRSLNNLQKSVEMIQKGVKEGPSIVFLIDVVRALKMARMAMRDEILDGKR